MFLLDEKCLHWLTARSRILLELRFDFATAVTSRLAENHFACKAAAHTLKAASTAFWPICVAARNTTSECAEGCEFAGIG